MQDPIVNVAITAARAAGNIIVRGFDRLNKIKISEKNTNDFVTDIDLQAEREIIDIIQKKFSNHGILSEEAGDIVGKDTTWIIDPLDGTHNFIYGFPHFAVSIAIAHKGKIEHGIIYDPLRQDLFTATRGKGARLNDKRIRVIPRKTLSECLLATGFPADPLLRDDKQATIFKNLISLAGDIRCTGSAALNLAYVAAGRLDGFWEFGLKPWDVAAGALLVKEAGGVVCDAHGDENYLTNGTIIAGTPKILKTLAKNIHLTL